MASTGFSHTDLDFDDSEESMPAEAAQASDEKFADDDDIDISITEDEPTAVGADAARDEVTDVPAEAAVSDEREIASDEQSVVLSFASVKGMTGIGDGEPFADREPESAPVEVAPASNDTVSPTRDSMCAQLKIHQPNCGCTGEFRGPISV